MHKHFPERMVSSFFYTQLRYLVIKALQVVLSSKQHFIAWHVSAFYIVDASRILCTHARFISNLGIFLLIDLLELDLFVNMFLWGELNNTRLGAKHYENEKDSNHYKAQVYTILCVQWTTEKWKFCWNLFCVCSKLEYSCHHYTNNTLLLSVYELPIGNHFWNTIDGDCLDWVVLLNFRSAEELHENHDVHPAKEEEEQ